MLDMVHQMNGAESKSGITEAQINLQIVLKIQQLLEQSGCTVILTRSDENAIYDLDAKTLKQKKISDIHNRVKIGNNSSADIFVSIHLNKINEQQYYGWQTFFNSSNEQSKVLAEEIQYGVYYETCRNSYIDCRMRISIESSRRKRIATRRISE